MPSESMFPRGGFLVMHAWNLTQYAPLNFFYYMSMYAEMHVRSCISSSSLISFTSRLYRFRFQQVIYLSADNVVVHPILLEDLFLVHEASLFFSFFFPKALLLV